MSGPQEPLKKCSKCSELKNESEFHYHSGSIDRLNSQCKKCQSETARNSQLFKKFGITLQQYELMLKSQNGVCAICNQPETATDNRNGKVKLLAIDHSHKTGNIRSLLCNRCNLLLGRIEVDIERSKKMIIYLEN